MQSLRRHSSHFISAFSRSENALIRCVESQECIYLLQSCFDKIDIYYYIGITTNEANASEFEEDIGKECTHNLTITSEDISLAVFLRK